MTQTLYSLRTDTHGYRITKFVDGEVESSYLTSQEACECPAGHRHTCRHRQMLPQMLAHGIADTHWFMDWDRSGSIVDFQGGSKRLYDQLAALDAIPGVTVMGLEDMGAVHNAIAEAVGEALLVAEETTPEPKPIRLFGEGGLVTEYYKHADAEPEPAPQQQGGRSWRRL